MTYATFLDLGTRTGFAILDINSAKITTFSESIKEDAFLRPEYLFNLVRDFTDGPIFFESATGQQGHAGSLYAGLEAAVRCSASLRGRAIACVHQSTLASFYSLPRGIKSPKRRKELRGERVKQWLGGKPLFEDMVPRWPEDNNEVDALALALYVLSGGKTTKKVYQGGIKSEEDLENLNNYINSLNAPIVREREVFAYIPAEALDV